MQAPYKSLLFGFKLYREIKLHSCVLCTVRAIPTPAPEVFPGCDLWSTRSNSLVTHSERTQKFRKNSEAGVRIENTELQIDFAEFRLMLKENTFPVSGSLLNVLGKQLLRPFEFQAVDMRTHKKDSHKGVSFASAEEVKELRPELIWLLLSEAAMLWIHKQTRNDNKGSCTEVSTSKWKESQPDHLTSMFSLELPKRNAFRAAFLPYGVYSQEWKAPRSGKWETLPTQATPKHSTE